MNDVKTFFAGTMLIVVLFVLGISILIAESCKYTVYDGDGTVYSTDSYSYYENAVHFTDKRNRQIVIYGNATVICNEGSENDEKP